MTTPAAPTTQADIDPAVFALVTNPAACALCIAYLDACLEVAIDKVTPPSAIVSELYTDCGALEQIRAMKRAIETTKKRVGL